LFSGCWWRTAASPAGPSQGGALRLQAAPPNAQSRPPNTVAADIGEQRETIWLAASVIFALTPGTDHAGLFCVRRGIACCQKSLGFFLEDRMLLEELGLGGHDGNALLAGWHDDPLAKLFAANLHRCVDGRRILCGDAVSPSQAGPMPRAPKAGDGSYILWAGKFRPFGKSLRQKASPPEGRKTLIDSRLAVDVQGTFPGSGALLVGFQRGRRHCS